MISNLAHHWVADSVKRIKPEVPIGFDYSTLLNVFTGIHLPIAVSLALVSFPAFALASKADFSKNIGSNHEKGT